MRSLVLPFRPCPRRWGGPFGDRKGNRNALGGVVLVLVVLVGGGCGVRSDPAPRTLYFATSKEPSTSVGAGRLADWLKEKRIVGFRWKYDARPDLTHANIFRSLEATALAFSLR